MANECNAVNGKSNATNEEDVILQFRIWEQGRVDLEELVEKLQLIVENALWEVITEYFMLPNDVISMHPIAQNAGIQCLNPVYDTKLQQWFDLGLDLKVVSLSHCSTDFISHHTTLNSMKELQKQILNNIADFKTKSFQYGSFKANQDQEGLYLPCNRHGMVPIIAEDDNSLIKLHPSYLLIGIKSSALIRKRSAFDSLFFFQVATSSIGRHV